MDVDRFYFYIYKCALLCKMTRAWYYLGNDELKLSKLCTLTITIPSFRISTSGGVLPVFCTHFSKTIIKRQFS